MTAATPPMRPMTMAMPRAWSEARVACWRARGSSSGTLDGGTFAILGEGPARGNPPRWYSWRRHDDAHPGPGDLPGGPHPRGRLQPGPYVPRLFRKEPV